MALFRTSLAAFGQSLDCPGCGRSLSGRDRAIYCPDCGRQVRCKNGWERAMVAGVSVAFALAHNLLFRRAQKPVVGVDGKPTPILVGYSNAMFKLGWTYERGVMRNLPEALRCYRKSARLGNLDATIPPRGK